MEKRHQVFVSSTFTDLSEERRLIMQTLMEMDCIPAGMELFPAADEEQWAFINRVIDDCDYYILLIGGRYGSTTEEGISYTEKEFDYAVSKGLHVIAFLHGDPASIPSGKTEIDKKARLKLEQFREKVKTNRLIRTWTTPAELSGLVALSLTKAIKTYPRAGWVRGGSASNIELLEQLNRLRVEKDHLEEKLKLAKLTLPVAEELNLAKGSELFSISGLYRESSHQGGSPWNISITWDELFGHLGPNLSSGQQDKEVNPALATSLVKTQHPVVNLANIDSQIFSIIKMQFVALDYVETDPFWKLTTRGKALLLKTLTVKSALPPATSDK